MFGQEQLIKRINKLIGDNLFPHFCIITGNSGSGKKTLVKEVIAPSLSAMVYPVETGIDSVRNLIREAYTIKNPMVYLIGDADKLSTPAKNALLKVTEEPPNDTYIIMTLQDLNNTLDTIRSRSTVFIMENYSRKELEGYYNSKPNYDEQECNIILDLCENPGEIDLLLGTGVKEFYDYVDLTVNNIAEVTGSNSFKIAGKISLKQDAEGYDLKMFLKAFMSICIQRMFENPSRYAVGVTITSKFLQQLGIKGISKQMLIDNWILEIRKSWNNF